MTAAVAQLELLRGDRRVAAALLFAVEGSAPLPPGAVLLVGEDGAIEGSLTGGCVESAVVQEAQALLRDGGAPRTLTYGIADDLAGTVGLTCGGTVHLLLHELRVADRAPLAAFLAAAHETAPAALATLLDGPRAGARLALIGERIHGSLSSGALLDRNVAADARGLLARGGSELLRYAADGAKHGDELAVLVQATTATRRLLAVGANDFSAALAPLARALGYRVTICDPRAAFASSPRFAQAAEVVVGWPAETLAACALGPRDAVLVLSHDPKLDVPAIRAALASEVGYVGVLGSRRTTAERARRLYEAGIPERALARISAPCGLDIGGVTAEEAAISILAEIVARRNGREGGRLAAASDTIRARPAC